MRRRLYIIRRAETDLHIFQSHSALSGSGGVFTSCTFWLARASPVCCGSGHINVINDGAWIGLSLSFQSHNIPSGSATFSLLPVVARHFAINVWTGLSLSPTFTGALWSYTGLFMWGPLFFCIVGVGFPRTVYAAVLLVHRLPWPPSLSASPGYGLIASRVLVWAVFQTQQVRPFSRADYLFDMPSRLDS